MAKNKVESRPRRVIKKFTHKFYILCEGDTEFNYFDNMRKIQPDNITLILKNMHGGGYSKFLEKIKESGNSNYLAKFIIIDLDVLKKNPNENSNFNELLSYCYNNNISRRIPIFIIINNPDFEYIACLHIPSFQGGDYHTFIKKDLKFRDIDKFKNKKEIYTYLNSKDNSYQVMIGRLKKCKYLSNIYSYNAKEKDVYIKRTIISKNNECQNGSNIEELFDLINTIIS